jgi:hypothetical protein
MDIKIHGRKSEPRRRQAPGGGRQAVAAVQDEDKQNEELLQLSRETSNSPRRPEPGGPQRSATSALTRDFTGAKCR